MAFSNRTLLTIVAEAVLEEDLIRVLREHKLNGWTLIEARGCGAHGEKHANFDLNKNIQIEVITEQQHAEQVAEHIARLYGAHYALILWLSDVRVMRAAKFN